MEDERDCSWQHADDLMTAVVVYYMGRPTFPDMRTARIVDKRTEPLVEGLRVAAAHNERPEPGPRVVVRVRPFIDIIDPMNHDTKIGCLQDTQPTEIHYVFVASLRDITPLHKCVPIARR